jgi:hypothetical protein
MKKTAPLVLLLTVMSIFYSCKKGNSAPTKIMTANVNGSRWASSTVSDNVSGTVGSNAILYINGISSSGQIIKLEVVNYNGVIGTYSVGAPGTSFKAYFYKDSSTYTAAAWGYLDISVISPSGLEGDFSFTTTDSIMVASGWFTAPSL